MDARSDDIQLVKLKGKPGCITVSASCGRGKAARQPGLVCQSMKLRWKNGQSWIWRMVPFAWFCRKRTGFCGNGSLSDGSAGIRKIRFCQSFSEIHFSRSSGRCSGSITPGAIPFQDAELHLEQILYLTRYIGYSRSFYLTVQTLLQPLSDIIMEGLDLPTVSGGMHRKEKLPGIIQTLEVSGYQPINQLLQSRPEFLLFLREIEQLERLFEDSNYLYMLMKSPLSIWVLYYLHFYGGSGRY